MASASLNLLKNPQSVIRKVNSTICASVKAARSLVNSASGIRFEVS
jgi:hypothetical protein